MTFDDVKKAITSEWLKLILLLIAVIGGWYKFDFRVSALETKQHEQDQQNQRLTETLAKLTDTLERINQTMRDFPPHLHVNDDSVIYPGDLQLQNGRRKKGGG